MNDKIKVRSLRYEFRWRTLFDQYDPEGFGEIPWPDFMVLLARGDFREEVLFISINIIIIANIIIIIANNIIDNIL